MFFQLLEISNPFHGFQHLESRKVHSESDMLEPKLDEKHSEVAFFNDENFFAILKCFK